MKYNLILLLAICVSTSTWAGDGKDFTKEYHEIFNISPGSDLNLINKYGPITIDMWEQNKIQIDIKITAKTGSQSKADQIFDRINISISGNDSEVNAFTEIDYNENSSDWWDKIFGGYDSGNFEISYTIKTPRDIDLDVSNKYGHIYINENVNGSAKLINKYGNIYAQDIDGNVNLTMGYGDVKMGNLNNLSYVIKYGSLLAKNTGDVTAQSKYSEISLGDIGNLTMESKYDDFKVENARKVTNNGKYDDFKFGTVEQFVIDTKYSDIKISEVTEKVVLTGKYNTMQIKSVANSTESITVDGKYTNLKMRVEGDFSLVFSGEYISPRLPSNFTKQTYIDDDNEVEIKGYRGSKSGTKITGDLRYGSFNVLD